MPDYPPHPNSQPPPHGLSRRLILLPRAGKRLLAMGLDALLCALTVWLAWCLRLEHWVPVTAVHLWTALGAWLLSLPIFWYHGLYNSIFRYSGWNAALALGKASAAYGALFALVVTVIHVPGVPRSVGIIQPLLMFIALGLSRVAVRLWLGDLYRELLRKLNAPGVLIYGAGAAGQQLAAGMMRMSDQRLIGFIDDRRSLQGRRLDGVRVYGPADLPAIIERHEVRDVLLAIPSAKASRRKEILELLRPYPVHVRTLPGLADLVSRGVSPSDVQDLDIEDLLGRDPVAPDEALMQQHLRGKTVLITGAGGSIGSELCRQVLKWQPKTLLLLDLSEFALYNIHRELATLTGVPGVPAVEIVPLQGSVQDAERLCDILAAWRPYVIYHAAAYKHVPLVEHNAMEGLRNNVWGTLTCARAAADHGVSHFVLISTDKAVRPTNVMGASKRLAEIAVQALAEQPRHRTCFAIVRFGNVLGSSGSVVPLFRRQIAQGGPVTLTHPDITRYFMTIPEAAQLVVQAGAMARGGDVFVLDMGEPIRIHDLASRMIELTGRRVRQAEPVPGDIEIRVTGLRPGEKLYEELLIGANDQPTAHPRILKAHERFLPWPELQAALQLLAGQMKARNHLGVRASLQQLVEGYRPSDPVVDWVHLAIHPRAPAPPPESTTPDADPAWTAPLPAVANAMRY